MEQWKKDNKLALENQQAMLKARLTVDPTNYRLKRHLKDTEECLQRAYPTEATETPRNQTQKGKTPKKKISAAIKKLVWNTNIGEEIGKTKCLCCKCTDITQISFNCGHIISEASGGETIVSNLKPICQHCNSSMGTKNMNDFMKTLK